jgi:hypothetical protein
MNYFNFLNATQVARFEKKSKKQNYFIVDNFSNKSGKIFNRQIKKFKQ